MSNLIGSWKANKRIAISAHVEAFTLPENSIVSVTQVDSDNGKVLVEFGPRTAIWRSDRFLSDFEKLD